MTMPRRPSYRLPSIAAAFLLAAVALPSPAQANPAYVRSTVGAPWGQTTNEQAMDLVFGPGGWDDLRYETLDPMVLLSPVYTFLYLEGSDNNASELEAFMTANQAELEVWVTNGGTLLLNAAPNEGGNQNWGFGGVTLNYPDSSIDPGTAVDPMHPIWQGPFLPTVDMWTGTAYAHASVNGPGLIPLMQDANGGDPNLAELAGPGMGRVLFGGLTTTNWWTPNPESLNLRANMIAYLAAGDGDMDGLQDFADNCPMDPNPMQEDMDGDGIGDVCDVCINDPGNDIDMDLVCAMDDNCPLDANPMQEDMDMDGLGDACDECPGDPGNDPDDDDICAAVDNCPMAFNPTQIDQDMDGIGAVCDVCPLDADDDIDMDMLCADADNCPADANPMQQDADMDGVGDVCDACPADDDRVADVDMDGVCLAMDNCPDDANVDQADADADGAGDVCDVCPGDADDDIDGDGVCGDEDNCPDDANDDQADEDGDGIGDVCDVNEDDSSGGGTSGGDDTTGDPDTAGDSGVEPDTGIGPGPMADSGAADSAGSTGSDPTGQDTDPGGCSCTTQPSRNPGLLLLLLTGLGWRRRRPAA